MKSIKYILEALIIYTVFLIIKFLGINIGRKISTFLFLKVGSLFRPNKNIKKNISHAYENLTEDEKNNIIKDMWTNYGLTFAEYLFMAKFRKNKFSKTQISVKGKDILEDVIKSGQPAIFISGHFANFELMSMEITKKSVKLATIYRPLNNYFLNPFMEFLRKRYVCKNQIKKGRAGVRDAMKFIDNGFSIALMIDQRVSEGETINLFNKPCLTTTLPAQLALKYDLNIVPVSIIRDNNNNFELTFHSAININQHKNKLDLTKHLNNHLESMLNKNPGQWIWTHNRWKL